MKTKKKKPKEKSKPKQKKRKIQHVVEDEEEVVEEVVGDEDNEAEQKESLAIIVRNKKVEVSLPMPLSRMVAPPKGWRTRELNER